jgi:hypothetical protein
VGDFLLLLLLRWPLLWRTLYHAAISPRLPYTTWAIEALKHWRRL